MTYTIGHIAPWWFSGSIGLVGVIAGLLLKWAIDALTSRGRNQREDQFRFVHDKRVAYADLLAAAGEVADIEHEGRQLVLEVRQLDANSRSSNEDIDAFNAKNDAHTARRERAYSELHRAASIVELIGPKPVVSTAHVLISRAHHPHMLSSRGEANAAYVDAARADLGHGPVGDLPDYEYEPPLEADSPESGLAPPN